MSDKHSNGTALAIVPRSINEASDLARTYATSALMPADLKGRAPDILVTILAGLELGMAPMAALRNIHVVKGKPILSADGMVGLVKASGLCESFACVEATNEIATYSTKRRGEKEQEFTFTIQDAQRAGLTGDNWKKYPRAMLMARAKAALARDVYPDVLAGVYEQGEVEEIEDRAPAPEVVDADFADDTPEALELEARILGAGNLPDLAGLVDQLKALPEGPTKVRLRDGYRAAQKRVVADYAASLKSGGGGAKDGDAAGVEGRPAVSLEVVEGTR